MFFKVMKMKRVIHWGGDSNPLTVKLPKGGEAG